MLIRDPNFFLPESTSKNLPVFKPKKWFLSSRKYDPGCSSRIRIPIFYPSGSRIQGSKRLRIRNHNADNNPLKFCYWAGRVDRYGASGKNYQKLLHFKQCSGAVTIWYGSGSLDPYTGLRIQLRIWILLFLAVAFKMPTKMEFLNFQSFFSYYDYINISLQR